MTRLSADETSLLRGRADAGLWRAGTGIAVASCGSCVAWAAGLVWLTHRLDRVAVLRPVWSPGPALAALYATALVAVIATGMYLAVSKVDLDSGLTSAEHRALLRRPMIAGWLALAALLAGALLAAHAEWATYGNSGLVGFGKASQLAWRMGLYSVVPLASAGLLLYAPRLINRAHAWRPGEKPPPLEPQ